MSPRPLAVAAACALALTLPAPRASAQGAPGRGAPRPASRATAALPRTRAERSGYTATSSYADVVAFLDSLQTLGAPLRITSLGRTSQGRDIPLVILSRPLVATPAEAQRLDRPVVYLQANIHAGEIEGKEVLQALIRDLAAARAPSVLDSLVLLVAPIYNADGNERLAPQAVNRPEQNGPALVGERPNGQGLDLNRDYVKAETPETRASLALFTRWDPDVFVDLQTTDGSYHGYALTYAPSLSPAAFFGGVYARDSLLPVLRRRLRVRDSVETFDYGNFSLSEDDRLTDSTKQGWYTYDPRPRFGTNYVGLRGRIALLTEAFSHDPLPRRMAATRAFVRETLSLVAERASAIRARSRAADSTVTGWGRDPAQSPAIPLRSELTRTPYTGPVLAEVLVATGDSTRTEPGLPRGIRRTGRIRTLRIPVYDRFTPTLSRRLPYAYALPATADSAVRLLRLHGVTVERLTAPWIARVERFALDSIVRAARPFQGHTTVRLEGRWQPGRDTLPAGSYLVSAAQPLGIVAAYLLEPESDDGLATWNVFDAALEPGGTFPVRRVAEPLAAPRRAIP